MLVVCTPLLRSNSRRSLTRLPAGPNGWRVVYVLKALNLSYKTIYLDFTRGEHKAANYLEKAPNGRIPTLVDHAESDFTVWESGAILLYLAERYDLDHDISAEGFEARSRQQQWLFFQASGQGWVAGSRRCSVCS